MPGFLTSDETLSDRQLARRRSFLFAVTFLKPYSIVSNRTLLAKSGVSQSKAKAVVWISFFIWFGLLILVPMVLLNLLRPPFGPASWLVYFLSIFFITYTAHYFFALFLVRYFKTRR